MTQAQAGWYADPAPERAAAATERYWDGFSWSHQVRPAQGASPTTTYPDRPYVAPTIPSTADGQLLAGWWARAGATALDALVTIPLLVLVALPSLVVHWHSVTTWWNDGNPTGGSGPLITDRSDPPPVLDPSTGPGLVLFASMLCVGVAYALVFLRWRQATPGKLAVGLEVRRRDARGALPWPTILRRVGVTLVLVVGIQVPVIGFGFLVVALLDYAWASWDDQRQALHDKVAGTCVVVRNS